MTFDLDSLRRQAERRLAESGVVIADPYVVLGLIDQLTSAVFKERKRCAKIAEKYRGLAEKMRCATDVDQLDAARSVGQIEAAIFIASKIRDANP